MSEKYQMAPEDEAAFRRSVLAQIALSIAFVGEGSGAPQAAIEPDSSDSNPATVDGSVTIEAKE